MTSTAIFDAGSGYEEMHIHPPDAAGKLVGDVNDWLAGNPLIVKGVAVTALKTTIEAGATKIDSCNLRPPIPADAMGAAAIGRLQEHLLQIGYTKVTVVGPEAYEPTLAPAATPAIMNTKPL